MESTTIQQTDVSDETYNSTIPTDFVVIAVVFFIIGVWLGHKLTNSGNRTYEIYQSNPRRQWIDR